MTARKNTVNNAVKYADHAVGPSFRNRGASKDYLEEYCISESSPTNMNARCGVNEAVPIKKFPHSRGFDPWRRNEPSA